MDLLAVRTFVAIADAGQFQGAADDLEVSQQAVSKRIAALERELGARLFTRTARGATLTPAGQAMLPHARELISSAMRMVASARVAPLRVDVVSRRIGPGALLRDFHQAHPDTELEVVTLFDAASAIPAVASGEVDATFRAVTMPPGDLPRGVRAARVLDEPQELLVGPGHPLAEAEAVTPAQLAGHPIWIPGLAPGTEWTAYYDEMAAAFGLAIDARGPNFGTVTMLDALAVDAKFASLVGHRSGLVWPAEYDLRRIPVRDPVPVYPHSLLWRADNPHPGLSVLHGFLATLPAVGAPGTWRPTWASRFLSHHMIVFGPTR